MIIRMFWFFVRSRSICGDQAIQIDRGWHELPPRLLIRSKYKSFLERPYDYVCLVLQTARI